MLTVHHDMIEQDGQYFPYLADTAWTLLQRLTREEILFYLDKRKAQGFNAVQVSAISELDGQRTPTPEGLLPFVGGNVRKPCRAYFDKLCFVADACAARGMVLTLLPYWGDAFNRKWGIGPEIFTPGNSAAYGRHLAGRIGRRENIIWMLGGDRPIETPLHREIIDATAGGLREGEFVRHPMTYHPNGENSSAFFLGDADYIDFHSIQSGHSFGGYKSEKLLKKSRSVGKKPVLDAECFYEDFPLGFELSWQYRFTPRDIRGRLYENLLTGTLGHTYGHQSVWCFREQPDVEYLYDWRTALDRPGAGQMRHINTLRQAVGAAWAKPGQRPHGIRVLEGNGFALTYLPDTAPRFIQRQQPERLRYVTWFDPESGRFSAATENTAPQFTAISPWDHDSVLIFSEEPMG